MEKNQRIFYSTASNFRGSGAESSAMIRIERSFSPAEFCPTLKRQRDSAPQIIPPANDIVSSHNLN